MKNLVATVVSFYYFYFDGIASLISIVGSLCPS
jgi:hypothetical protein